jgi:DNA-binding transcriptional regulator YhcF (GntR family)
MTAIQQIKSYISYTPRPFLSAQLVVDLGICYETVKKYLQELLAEDYIKHIGTDKGKNVYIYNKRKPTNKPFKMNTKKYTIADIQEVYRRQIQKRREEFDDLL